MIEYFLYLIYTRMISNKDDDPFFRSFVYVGVIVFLLFFSSVIILQGLIEYLFINKLITFKLKNNLIIGMIFLFIVTNLVTYFRFFYKKNGDYYIQKYKNCWFNKYFSNFITLLLFPLLLLLLLLLGPLISVFLFGGESFGEDVKGILNW